MSKIKLAERLKQLRTEKGLKQYEVAQALGITVPTYNHWELGRFEPDLSSLVELSQFFNVDVGYLIGVNDVKDPTGLNEALKQIPSQDYQHVIAMINAFAAASNKKNDKNK